MYTICITKAQQQVLSRIITQAFVYLHKHCEDKFDQIYNVLFDLVKNGEWVEHPESSDEISMEFTAEQIIALNQLCEYAYFYREHWRKQAQTSSLEIYMCPPSEQDEYVVYGPVETIVEIAAEGAEETLSEEQESEVSKEQRALNTVLWALRRLMHQEQRGDISLKTWGAAENYYGPLLTIGQLKEFCARMVARNASVHINTRRWRVGVTVGFETPGHEPTHENIRWALQDMLDEMEDNRVLEEHVEVIEVPRT